MNRRVRIEPIFDDEAGRASAHLFGLLINKCKTSDLEHFLETNETIDFRPIYFLDEKNDDLTCIEAFIRWLIPWCKNHGRVIDLFFQRLKENGQLNLWFVRCIQENIRFLDVEYLNLRSEHGKNDRILFSPIEYFIVQFLRPSPSRTTTLRDNEDVAHVDDRELANMIITKILNRIFVHVKPTARQCVLIAHNAWVAEDLTFWFLNNCDNLLSNPNIVHDEFESFRFEKELDWLPFEFLDINYPKYNRFVQDHALSHDFFHLKSMKTGVKFRYFSHLLAVAEERSKFLQIILPLVLVDSLPNVLITIVSDYFQL